MTRMKKRIFHHGLAVLALVVLILFFSFFCGCVEVGADDEPQGKDTQEFTSPTPKPPSAQEPSIPWEPWMGVTPDQYYQENYPSITGASVTGPGLATYTDPIPPSIVGDISHRMLNQSPEFFPRPFDYPTAPFFQEAYSLSWNNIALVAKPESPPFVIEFKVEAGTKNPYDAQVLITVRDNVTGRVVAEEGYNGAYSSEPEKRIIIREAGEYHINMYGYKAGVHIILRGGVPEDQAVPYGTFTTRLTPPVAQVPGEYYQEEEFW
ncbi:MAG: hypothetical protein A4E36_00139 [Methanoregulaceae archaeon PtaB.Bin009]|nr:MAG: hypothetical protein A4E36_00139 [Methanoregulaceae archaeon PtaB.Bin009]